MLEPRYSTRLVALPQPLGLPVAHSHQHRAIGKPKYPRLHPRQHSASLQLSLTQCCPPHSTSLGGHLKGTLLSRSQGDIIKVAQHESVRKVSGAATIQVRSVNDVARYLHDTTPVRKRVADQKGVSACITAHPCAISSNSGCGPASGRSKTSYGRVA